MKIRLELIKEKEMLCTQDARLFVPYGRLCYQIHPGASNDEKRSPKFNSHFSLNNFKDISLDGHVKESWHVRSSSLTENCDEELYFKDNLVVWSRSVSGSSSQIVKCFTMDSNVIEALWCNFLLPLPPRSSTNKVRMSDNPCSYVTVQPCVCVIEGNRMSFFCDDGQNYTSHIPMPVKKVWVMKNGLLFERNTSSDFISSKNNFKEGLFGAQKLTTLFSLIHPLDELIPVICKSGVPNQPPVSFLTDHHQEIVFVSEDPSMVVTFHHQTRKHSIWSIRWTTQEEVDFLSGRGNSDACSVSMNNSKPTDAPKMTPKPANSSSTSRRTYPSLSPGLDSSHFPSHSSKLSHSSYSYSHLSSPNFGSRTLGFNRTNSPQACSEANRFASPSQSAGSPSLMAISSSPFTTKMPSDPAEPLAPEVCLEHIWTESIISREGEAASKVFFTCDFSGQQYFCMLINSKQQLRCMKFEDSTEKVNYFFGNTSTILAKDAVPLVTLNLMVILDVSNLLILYSGLQKLNVIHISGLSSLNRMTQIGDVGPLTSSRPASSMDIKPDDVSLSLSPVGHDVGHSNDSLNRSFINSQFTTINDYSICSLRDPVENRFTIELFEGDLCRIEMSEISSSSPVTLCLLALRSCLPEHLVMTLFSKWYLARNTPGVAGYSPEWSQFSTFLLASLGYISSQSTFEEGHSCNMSPSSKKRRLSVDGSDADWHDMLASSDFDSFKEIFFVNFDVSASKKVESKEGCNAIECEKQSCFDSKAFLYSYIYHVFFNLHLVYEEMKLDVLLQSNLLDLGGLLCQLSMDMNLPLYTDHYCRDLPSLYQYYQQKSFKSIPAAKAPAYFCTTPPSILEWLFDFLTCQNVSAFPVISSVTCRTLHVITIYTLKFLKDKSEILKYIKVVDPPPNVSPVISFAEEENADYSILRMAVSENVIQSHLSPCLRIPVTDAVHNCRKNPSKQWDEETYKLIGREDLASLCRIKKNEEKVSNYKDKVKSFLNEDRNSANKTETDGMDQLDSDLLKLRFDKDLRIKEIKKLLQSSHPTRVSLQQKPGVSDHEFIDEQEKYLYSVCVRTMSLPVGRGMLTYGTYVAVPTEALSIPKLCLSGKVPPRNNIIEMTHIELPPNLTEWPQFHNGVAAGLRLSSSAQLDSTWILFNKLKSENLTNEHAGFLMGQGLTGRLSDLACLDVHDYLIKGNEMISIGLLLGMAADKIATMDITATKTLSIHIAALLPPSSAELDVTHNIQVASVLGMGLVYQSSGHRHYAEVLLAEIGRPPGPEMENSVDRESYSLAAGLALGNVMLAKGTKLLDVSGSEMPDYLFYYMNGRKRKPLSNAYRERYKTTSCQIKEGECVNIDVTGPGAIMALSLMFFDSGNSSVAEWLVAPDTPSLLECMKPDLLMLRTIGYGLIMWKLVTPTDKWINSNIPEIVKECAFDRCQISENPECNLDIELMSQDYVNIIAGACMVIALKYAGSANKEAFECLYRHFQQIYCWQKTPECIEYAGKYTLEQCLCVLVLCMAMVMAGTGDIEVLRICRHLRSRIASHVHYGNHMAIGMATGLLALGGGKCTLSTKPEAIAAMLCAFFPKFPIHANDNKFHLQAFRHLYVLAIEKRILVPCDVDTNKACYADLQLFYQNGKTEMVTAPCLLPELNLLSEIKVFDRHYWQVEFKKTENWDTLKTILSGRGYLYVKQKINFISQFKDIPDDNDDKVFGGGGNEFLDKIFKYKDISSFTKDPYLVEFSSLFFKDSNDVNISQLCQFLFRCLYNKITETLPVQIDVHQNIILSMKRTDYPFLLWQFKILCAYYKKIKSCSDSVFALVTDDFLISMENSIEVQLSKCIVDTEFQVALRSYFTGDPASLTQNNQDMLSTFLTWYHIPFPHSLTSLNSYSFSSLLPILKKRGLSVSSIKVLSRVLTTVHQKL